MRRVSLEADTLLPRSMDEFHTSLLPTTPVTVSILRLVSWPYHFTVVKVAEKMSLSCCEMFGVDVADAAAAPTLTSMLASASRRPSTTWRGSDAEKYLPCPLIAACHRSSTRDW